ncbi:MAG: hypothetical protein ACLTPG_04825 [Mediterraneibacter gnavus]
MFPIGRGQRELIIGDRQTGKTSIASRYHFKPEGQRCDLHLRSNRPEGIYRCEDLVNTLKKHDAIGLYHRTVLQQPVNPASLQYIAPYAGTALAEYFMYQGKDVLIVYDDLSKHAVCIPCIVSTA